MSRPGNDSDPNDLVSTWRRRPAAPAAPAAPEAAAASAPVADYDQTDIARGSTEAVLGLLGRMQLRLDVLAREQAAALARIEGRLSEIERQMGKPT